LGNLREKSRVNHDTSKFYASKLYTENEYLILLKNVFVEVYRILVNGERACINVANLGRKPYIPLSDYISKMMIDIGFNMRGEIIWNKGASASPSTAWGSWQRKGLLCIKKRRRVLYFDVFSWPNFQKK